MVSALLILALPIAPLPALHGGVIAPPACITMNTRNLPLATRKSPLDSISFKVGAAEVKVCYGRPAARGRTMLGGEGIPYGKLWRTGANEPTMIHTTGPLTIAGVRVPAGSYSLYSVPGKEQWEIIVNRSITQWGHESEYTDSVKAKEVGRGKAKAERTSVPVETFTIRAEPAGKSATLLLEWEGTRVRVPVAAGE